MLDMNGNLVGVCGVDVCSLVGIRGVGNGVL